MGPTHFGCLWIFTWRSSFRHRPLRVSVLDPPRLADDWEQSSKYPLRRPTGSAAAWSELSNDT
jgi:hypothetical protein